MTYQISKKKKKKNWNIWLIKYLGFKKNVMEINYNKYLCLQIN